MPEVVCCDLCGRDTRNKTRVCQLCGGRWQDVIEFGTRHLLPEEWDARRDCPPAAEAYHGETVRDDL